MKEYKDFRIAGDVAYDPNPLSRGRSCSTPSYPASASNFDDADGPNPLLVENCERNMHP